VIKDIQINGLQLFGGTTAKPHLYMTTVAIKSHISVCVGYYHCFL